MPRVTIEPITRLEGHGKIEIFLDDAGEVENAYFQVPELRGFEQFLRGRPAEDMPVLTNRICGVCPEAHHMAAVKALDVLFQAEPPPAALRIRELLYMAFVITDHVTHFFALGGPDLIVGPDAPAASRNILGVVGKVGRAAAAEVIAARHRNHEVVKLLGGKPIHPAAGLPGGWSKAVRPEEQAQLEAAARANVEFARQALRLFDELVWQDPAGRDLILSEVYLHRTHSLGTVDARNRLNFYDGTLRVLDPDGAEVARFRAADHAQHIAERVEPWTYMKFPYLRAKGWRGFEDGPDSGVYTSTPLSRLNVSDTLATPLAQAELTRFRQAMGGRMVHHRLATHWARLIEVLYAAERMLELARDPELTDPRVRTIPSGAVRPEGGVGQVEAPRGCLIHEYRADERGRITYANLIVGTTNNHAAIAMSVKRAAQRLIRAGRPVADDLLNRVEMAFRLYDPCLSCSTHALPGRMALEVVLRDRRGRELSTFRRG